MEAERRRRRRGKTRRILLRIRSYSKKEIYSRRRQKTRSTKYYKGKSGSNDPIDRGGATRRTRMAC